MDCRHPTSKHSRWLGAVFLALAVISVVLISRCDAGSTEAFTTTDDKYPVLDSGFGSGIAQTFWLDNENVIFRGYEGDKPKDGLGRPDVKRGIYIWNVEENAIFLFARDGLGYCYFGGKIYYVQGGHWIVDWYETKMTGTVRPELIEGDELDYRSLNCLKQNRPSGTEKRAVYSLLPEHGYLDIGPLERRGPRKNTRLTYFATPIQSDGILLPVGRRQVQRMRYFEFKGAYLLTGPKFDEDKGYAESWRSGVERPVWWLYPGGRFEEHVLPFEGSILGGSVVIEATSKGFLVVSNAVGLDANTPGNAGIWLSTRDALEKVIVGVVDGASVSPDGCRVAFAYAPNMSAIRLGTPGRRTLRYVDVCDSQGEDL